MPIIITRAFIGYLGHRTNLFASFFFFSFKYIIVINIAFWLEDGFWFWFSSITLKHTTKCVFGIGLKSQFFYCSVYFCYYVWVSLHFWILFISLIVLFHLSVLFIVFFFFFCWFPKVFSGFYSRTNPSRYSREPRRGSLSRKFAASTRTRNRDHLLKQPEPLSLRPTFLGLFTVFSTKSFQFQLNNLFLNRY